MKNHEISMFDYHLKDIEKKLKKIDPEQLDDIWKKAEIIFFKKISRIIRLINKKAGNNPIKKEVIIVKLKKMANSHLKDNEACLKFDQQTIKMNMFERIILSVTWTNYLKTIEPALLSLIPYIISTGMKYYKKYSNVYNIELIDIVSEGHSGMLKAIPGYNYKKAEFITYATPWIKGAIQAYIDGIIKNGVFTESISDISELDGIDTKEKTIDDVLIDSELIELLREMISSELTPKQSIAMKKNLYSEMKQKDIATQLEMSKSALSQLLKRAIQKLTEIFKKRNLF